MSAESTVTDSTGYGLIGKLHRICEMDRSIMPKDYGRLWRESGTSVAVVCSLQTQDQRYVKEDL